MTDKRVIISLFDASGLMLMPWQEAGYKCYAFDLSNRDIIERGIDFIQAEFPSRSAEHFIKLLSPLCIFSFPPCTDLTSSGARHFSNKANSSFDFQMQAVELCRTAERLGQSLRIPWFVENPAGALSKLWRPPNTYFNPSDYGGYLPEDDIHPLFPEYFPPRDAYSKKTGLWFEGFRLPDKKPVKEMGNWLFEKLGGKSERTKYIRSLTPRGFARAFFEANHGGL